MQAALCTAPIDDVHTGSASSRGVWSQLVGSTFRSLGRLPQIISCDSSLQRVTEEQEPARRGDPSQSCSLATLQHVPVQASLGQRHSTDD